LFTVKKNGMANYRGKHRGGATVQLGGGISIYKVMHYSELIELIGIVTKRIGFSSSEQMLIAQRVCGVYRISQKFNSAFHLKLTEVLYDKKLAIQITIRLKVQKPRRMQQMQAAFPLTQITGTRMTGRLEAFFDSVVPVVHSGKTYSLTLVKCVGDPLQSRNP
jgi:hypothetical protein